MEVIEIQPDDTERLIASDLDSEQANEVREWFSYIKPIGHDLKVVVRQAPSGDHLFVHVAGNDPDAA